MRSSQDDEVVDIVFGAIVLICLLFMVFLMVMTSIEVVRMVFG